MNSDDTQLLRDQLRDALDDPDAEALEVAAIAGLLARLDPNDALLDAARARAGGASAAALRAAALAAAGGGLGGGGGGGGPGPTPSAGRGGPPPAA